MMTATSSPAPINPNIAKRAFFAFHIRINLPSVGFRDRTQNCHLSRPVCVMRDAIGFCSERNGSRQLAITWLHLPRIRISPRFCQRIRRTLIAVTYGVFFFISDLSGRTPAPAGMTFCINRFPMANK